MKRERREGREESDLFKNDETEGREEKGEMGEGDVEERECREERVIFREIGFNVLLGVCRLFLNWMLTRVRKGGGGVISTTRREMDSLGEMMKMVSGRD